MSVNPITETLYGQGYCKLWKLNVFNVRRNFYLDRQRKPRKPEERIDLNPRKFPTTTRIQ